MQKFEVNHHGFTSVILAILKRHYGECAQDIFEASAILGYLNSKTRAASRGSKARGAFANHYALYVIVEDYVKKGFLDGASSNSYAKYEGARFSDLFKRQRELPFGSKLQNHALNSRLNDEFKKFYPAVGKPPIVRDVATQRYWIQEDLIQVRVRDRGGVDSVFSIAPVILEIIDQYVAAKKAAFEGFLDACKKIADIGKQDPKQAEGFILEQLAPSADARVFEIVSYAVLKAKFGLEVVWLGVSKDAVEEQNLALYKTGRTNANDGGIDFVMRPLGRFFQVTETLDANKYFLDIDKVQRFPVTFVVKSIESAEQIRAAIKAQAVAKYKIDAVVEKYMAAVEDILNVPALIAAFGAVVQAGGLQLVMHEIVTQSMVEFNYDSDIEDVVEPDDAGDE